MVMVDGTLAATTHISTYNLWWLDCYTCIDLSGEQDKYTSASSYTKVGHLCRAH